MSVDYALLAPTQRSGSTLLQRLFNANPRNLIWGEQGGALCDLAAAHGHLTAFSEWEDGTERARVLGTERTSGWTANACPDRLEVSAATVAATRALLSTLYARRPPGVVHVGFKEVRYGPDEVRLLRRACPDVKLVAIVRDPAATYASIKQQNWPTRGFARTWTQNVLSYLADLAVNENAWVFRLSDLVARRPATLDALSAVSGATATDLAKVLDTFVAGPAGYVAPPALQLDKKTEAHIVRGCGRAVAALRGLGDVGKLTSCAVVSPVAARSVND